MNMFRPFFAFVGCRYTRAKRKNHFISFISLTSMLGIALGVMVLITVLSVMNGFSKEIRQQILSVTPHITLRAVDGRLEHWHKIIPQLQRIPAITGAAPYILSHGMLVESENIQPVLIRGIDPSQIQGVYPLAEKIIQGNFTDLAQKKFAVLLGTELAAAMGVNVGDKITLMVPETNITIAGATPRMKSLLVVGIFKSGTFYDNNNIFINLQDAAKLLRMHDGISGIQIKVQDELQTENVITQLEELLPQKYSIADWTAEHANFLRAIQMEKTVMCCILLLIIAVAAFNLVSSLVMMVNDKRADIAIMRAMGASRNSMMGIFIIQGSIIGIVGTALGLVFGLLLAGNVTAIVDCIQNFLSVKFVSEDIYFVGFVPSNIHALDVAMICLFSFVMSLLATIYPAYRAANVQPAEALRYE